MKKIVLFFTLTICTLEFYSQNGVIKGKVFNSINNEAVPFASVGIASINTFATADIDGKYELKNLTPGLYNITASFVGFGKKTVFEIEVKNYTPTVLNIALEQQIDSLSEVEITASANNNKTEESPVSLRTIGSSEIDRNPGGNRDISKVIQSLPGVASTVSFRNDIIIRGGAPNENRFYLDGIEVPNINHFATQGGSGGPVGMINVNFIREVDFYSGAFPVNRGNALSSIFDFKQKDGNSEKLVTTATLGSSDLGLTLDGPLGKKTTFIVSARRSYLGWLFKLLELPFLPIYNDAQFKTKIRFNDKNEISLIGLGAIDDFKLNLDANKTEQQKYILGYLPVFKQWNYALGANYKHFYEKSYLTLVVSRNHLNNRSYKYINNDESIASNKILDYVSQEIENKIRIEDTYRHNGFKINIGAGLENVTYTNSTFNKINTPFGVTTIDFNSKLNFNKYALFGQISKSLFKEKLVLSVGARTDFSDYSSTMGNPLNQFSPRFSMSLNITNSLSFNFNIGRYFQLPAYTVLGYRDSANVLSNKDNKVTYISNDQIVAGIEYNTKINTKIAVEGFYKIYDKYPLTIRDSLCLANLGGDYGVVGNEPVASISKGQAYGLEFLIQQKLYKGFYGIIAYTWVKSQFQDKRGNYKPSAWDNGNIISITFGKKFKKNWEAGIKWRYLGGTPYTPIDVQTSSIKTVWDLNGRGIPNYDQLNTKRLKPFHQLDMRVDKKFFLKKWSLDIYFDIQNAYQFKADQPPVLLLDRDVNGNAQTDPGNPAAYKTKLIDNPSRGFTETLGIIIEF
ncbi:MAG: TonB-dependent receptor [Bacteroidetes bacterium]|nr:TonB-dependent receptor [Bacteroidota bacterium]